MKIKVDKKEYESLLARVDELEGKVDRATDYGDIVLKRMREEINNYFENQCRMVLVKRDKNEIVAEIKNQITNNMFKGVK